MADDFQEMMEEWPSVTAVLATADRPVFCQMALAIFRTQVYPGVLELVIVDDGEISLDSYLDLGEGELHIRADQGTDLGTKLNLGIAAASGSLLWKMDDDDYYAPGFLRQMVAGMKGVEPRHGPAAVSFLRPYIIFDLEQWLLRLSDPRRAAGGTLVFTRRLWEMAPFQAIDSGVDARFLRDHLALGLPAGRAVPQRCLHSFVQVRHGQNTWTHLPDGRTVRRWLESCDVYQHGPEDIIPQPLISIYSALATQSGGLLPCPPTKMP